MRDTGAIPSESWVLAQRRLRGSSEQSTALPGGRLGGTNCRRLGLNKPKHKFLDLLRRVRNYLRSMRTSPILEVLFPDIRAKILSVLLLQPEKRWYLTELASRLETQPSSLQRELEALSKAGLLEQTKDGRRVYFRADTNSPVFEDLRGLLEKTVGLVPILKQEVDSFGERIQLAFIYGSTARSEESSESDVDIMIVGDVGLADLVPSLRRAERRFGRPVNPTIYSPKEFSTKSKNNDHFLTAVLRGAKEFVKGNDGDLAAVAG
jgi:DNA-binding transcriptional ArsR family regulator